MLDKIQLFVNGVEQLRIEIGLGPHDLIESKFYIGMDSGLKCVELEEFIEGFKVYDKLYQTTTNEDFREEYDLIQWAIFLFTYDDIDPPMQECINCSYRNCIRCPKLEGQQ